MPIYSVQGPDGRIYDVEGPAGASEEQIIDAVRRQYLMASGPAKPAQDTTGFKAAAAAGFERLKGETALTAGKLGLMDTAEAEKYQKEKEAAAQARFTPTEEGWTEAPWQKFKETLGGSVPYMAAPVAAGLGALAAPVAAPTAAVLGAGLAGLTSAGQFTGSNLARQMDTGKTLEQTSLGAAVGAAIPQAALDTAAMALMPGVGKLFGSVGAKLTTAQAEAIAKQTLSRAAADYAAKTGVAMGREGLTETAQQVLERVQAGLEIADPEARKEYIDSFIGGAALAGVGAPAGRYIERSAAKTQAADAQQARIREKRMADEALAKEEEAAKEAEKQTPGYALKVEQDYLAAEQQKAALKAQIKKGTKEEPLNEADKAFNADINAQLKALQPTVKELGQEFNRTAKVREQAKEQARVENLTPEEFMLEQTMRGEGMQATGRAAGERGALFERESAPVAPVDTSVQDYATGQIEAARSMGAMGIDDYVGFLMQDPTMADQMVKTRTKMPDLTRQENEAVLGALKLQLKERDKQQASLAKEGEARAERIQSAMAGQAPGAELLGAMQRQPGVQAAQQARAAEEARVAKVTPEVEALQRIGERPAGGMDQVDMFGKEGEPQSPSAALGQMQQQLLGEDVTFTGAEQPSLQRGDQVPFALRGRAEGTEAPVTREDLADRINRVLSTYDLSPEAVDFLRRVEQTLPQSDTTIQRGERIATVGGRPVRVQQDTGSYFDLLNQQLERIESGAEGVPRKSRRAIELQAVPTEETRAETAPPTEATAEDIKKYRSAQPGQARTMTQMEQAALEQRRAEGKGGRMPGYVYQPEGERTTTTAGPTAVSKRVTDTTPTTLKGPSALPQDLSMAQDVEEQLRLLETVADEGVQRPLFPEEQESVKLTRAGFQTYLKSPKVEALRKALRRDQEILKRAEQIPALEQRAKSLVEEIDGILKAYAEYRSADAIVQANKDVTQARRDIAEIRSAAGKATVNRMLLAGRVQQLQEARLDVLEEGRRQGETVEPEFLAELDAVTEALQEAQTDMALLDSALSVLDGQLRSFDALKKMSALADRSVAPERIPAAQQELQAVKTELEKLREDYNEVNNRLRKDAADRKRADEAVKEAERKAAIEAGRVKPIEEAKQQLPAYDRAVQYPALTEAQRLAREKGGTLPELSEDEKVKIKGEPTQVLGGYRKEVTRLEKAIRNAQDSARESLRKQLVGPKQEAFDRINARYKAAKSAAERDVLGPRLDVAQKLLARAEDKVKTAPITWRGMKRDIAQLADAINKVDWLEGMIDAGRVEVEERVPRTAKQRVSAEQLAAERAQAAQAAVERAKLPSTSGEKLTRSEAKKAGAPKKTQFEGKGVPGGVAVEIGGPTTLEKMQRIAAERAKRGVYRVSEGGKGVSMETLGRLINRITSSWKNVPTIVAAANFDALPEKIKAQAEADGVAGNIPGVYDPDTKTVYLVADALHNAEDVVATVAHEIAGHFGLREMLRGDYAKVMNDVYNGNKSVREQADAKIAAMPSLSREVAVEEVLADMAESDPNAQGKGALRKVYDAIKRWFRETLGFDKMTDKAVQQIVANARKYVIEGTGQKAGEAPKTAALYRAKAPKYANDELAQAGYIASKVIANQKPFTETIKEEGLGMGLVTRLVDRFAPLEKIAKLAEPLKGTQMMYYARMFDQKMHFLAQSVSNGALALEKHTRKDGRDEWLVESKSGASIKGVVDILKDAKDIVGSADAASQLFSLYTVAKRAERVGLNKMNFGGAVSQAELDSAMRTIKATPGLERVFEDARKEYNAFNKGMVQFAVDTGALSKDVAKKLLQSEDYVPFYRERNGAVEMVLGNETIAKIGNLKNQPYLKELVGGEERIIDFMTSSVQNANMLTDMSLRNLATKSAVFELQELGMAKIGKGTASGTDVVNFKQHGEDFHAVIDTAEAGFPAELLVKGMEGIPYQTTWLTKAMGVPAKVLRQAVTLNPMYAARQLFRDSLAAPILSGADFKPIIGALKQINQPAGKTLEQRGITGGQVFSGTQQDLSDTLRRLSSGESGWLQGLAKLEALSMEADALTRRAQYNSYIEQGLSEMEATYAALESMNFSKRGSSPAMHFLSTVIPFFNAQIQSLNVLYKAFTGDMPFNEKLKVREKLLKRGAMLASATILYAALMQDDETYENATPEQKYGNWFIHVPGFDEAVKLPIPFEIGYIFKALPEALVNAMAKKEGGEEALAALKQIALQTIPGGTSYGLPQAIKPLIEVGLGKSFYTGRDLESAHEQMLEPGKRVRDKTTDFARVVGDMFNVSPIKIDALISGYLSSTGLAMTNALSFAIPTPEGPSKTALRTSEIPLVGGLFQPKDAGGVINAAYDRMAEAKQIKATFEDMVAKGQKDAARQYLQENLDKYAQSSLATNFTSTMQKLAQAERAIRASALSPDEKRARLDELRQMKIRIARNVREAANKTTPR